MRIPREVLRNESKYVRGAAHKGVFSCPHLDIACMQNTARQVLHCPGYDHCSVRQVNKLVDRLWIIKSQ